MTDLEVMFREPGIFQYGIIDSATIPFSQMVADACKANSCGRYGTCWTCPPAVGTMQEMEQKIKAYKKAVVFSAKYALEDWCDYDGMVEGKKKTMDILRRIADKLRAEGRDIMVLGCGGCNICEKCTYPDEQCRFPQKAIVSVEACGINVVELAKKTGIRYNNGTDTVTYFCIVLFEKEGEEYVEGDNQ